MIVALNGIDTELPDGASLAGVLAELGVPTLARGVAVAVQGEIVPRGDWPTTSLREGDHVEVVSAIQGG